MSVTQAAHIGPFRIQEGPFEGAFGQVWRVFDSDSGDEFALKSLKGDGQWPPQRLAAFQREIGLWIGLPVHPNVVRALRAFEHAGRPFVLIEWVPGGNLREWLDKPRAAQHPAARQQANTLELLRQLAEGVAHIHDHGLVHGDLKPANLMMWIGSSPQVSDFGFARAAADGAAPRGGTRSYMAPELAQAPPTQASDIFAVGVIFKEVLLARATRAAADAFALAEAMCSPRSANRPASLHAVVGTLATLIEGAGWPPSVGRRLGPRLTWDEQHVNHVLPHRVRYSQAMTELAAGRAAQARSALESLVSERPKMLDARLALIALMMRDGETEAARTVALAAPPPDPSDTTRVLQLAERFVGFGCVAQATALIEPLFANALVQFDVWRLRGHIALVEGRISDAIDGLQQALALREDGIARLELAGLLREAGLLDQALDAYSHVGLADTGLAVKAALGKARIQADRGQHDAALNALHALLRRPLHAAQQSYVYTEMGYLYARQQLPEAAAAAYRKALAHDPGNSEARDGLQNSTQQAAR